MNNQFTNDGSFMAQFLAQQAGGAGPGASAPTAAGAAPGTVTRLFFECGRTTQTNLCSAHPCACSPRACHLCLISCTRPLTPTDVFSLQS